MITIDGITFYDIDKSELRRRAEREAAFPWQEYLAILGAGPLAAEADADPERMAEMRRIVKDFGPL